MDLIKSQEYSVANGGETLCKHVSSNKGRIDTQTQKQPIFSIWDQTASGPVRFSRQQCSWLRVSLSGSTSGLGVELWLAAASCDAALIWTPWGSVQVLETAH